MKKLVILIFLCTVLLCILQNSIITADIFNVGNPGGDQIVIGGSQKDIFTGIPEAPVTPPVGGGNGGGRIYNFELSKTFLALEIKKGIHYQEEIIIINNGTEDLTINISITNLGEFIFLEQGIFVLKAGERKNIRLDIYVSESLKNDVYIGKINFNSLNINKFVNVVLDVKEKTPLFDIKTTILKKYIVPGGKVRANLVILNLGDLKNIDVELEYQVRDFDNKTYTSKKESFAINDSFTGEVFLETPKYIKLGDYIFYSKVNYGDISASSYDVFVIEKVSFIMWLITVLIIIDVIILIAIIIKRKSEKKF